MVLVAGCAARVSPIPPTARAQVPASGSPAAVEWVARDGRLTLVGGGRRISARIAVHRLADGRVRFGIITDEGVVLADLVVDGESVTAVALRPEVEPTVGVLAHLVRQAWVTPRDEPHLDGAVAIGQWGASRRTYGGDPVLLRTVSGGGPDLVIEDYRLEPLAPTGLLAHAVRAEGLGYSVQLTIEQVGAPTLLKPLPPLPAAATPSADLF